MSRKSTETEKTATLSVTLVRPPVAPFDGPILLRGRFHGRVRWVHSEVLAYRMSVVRKDQKWRGLVRKYHAGLVCTETDHRDHRGFVWPAHLVRSADRTAGAQPAPQPDDWLVQLNQGVATGPTMEIVLGRQPDWKIGQEVWGFIEDKDGDRIIATRVRAWNLDVGPDVDRILGVVASYCCSSEEDPARDISSDDLFTSQADAAHNVEFLPVVASADEWLAAIGDRYDGDDFEGYRSVEESELGICCDVICDIRDALLQCQRQGGLSRLAAARLQGLLNKHEHDGTAEVLPSILAQLELTWPTEPCDD